MAEYHGGGQDEFHVEQGGASGRIGEKWLPVRRLKPFRKSSTKTAIPRLRPNIRMVLVAPALWLPCPRTSVP